MRLAIVTGTTRGLGREIALALLARGWNVLGVARGSAPKALHGDRYVHACLDLADHDAVVAWFENELPARYDLGACERLGLHVLRIGTAVPTRIVHLSSGAAGTPYPGWTAYCATKAALAMAGRVLAAELEEVRALRGRDVALVSYAPNIVDTDMQREIRAASAESFPRRDRFVEFQRQGNLVAPAEPAAEIAGLLESDDLPPYDERRFNKTRRGG